MPIHYNGKDYEFGELVEHIKRTKPGIKSPGGYVKSIEQNQHLSQKISKLKIATGTPRVENGGDCPECTGKGKDYRNNCPTCEGTGKQMFKSNLKIRPPKPTQKDRNKIIEARLNDLREEITEKKIARLHNHKIEWHENPIGMMKVASLVDATGKFVKYWLLNAKQINGNGWGVSPISIAQNIKKFKGKPFVVTAQTWIPESEYGMEYRHPTIMSNDLGTIFRYQAKYAVGLIRDVYEEKDNWYATVEMSPKYAHLALPPFCSPAIFQLDPFEPEGALTKWEALHLAGLFEQPAYGAQIALLKGTCIGTSDQCTVQFKGAELKKKEQVLEASYIDTITAFKHKTPHKSGNYSTDGQSLKLFGNTIAKHSDKGLQVSNANFDTQTTYKALDQLGADITFPNGVTHINGKPYKHGTFVTIPYNEVKDRSIIQESGSHRRADSNETLQRLRAVRKRVMEKYQGMSQTSIQPNDQRLINKITGIKKPIGKTVRGTAIHHILYRRDYPGLQFNINNIIPLDRPSHSEAHRFDVLRKKMGQLKVALAGLNMQSAPKVKINPMHGRTIADAYDRLKHDPTNPEVKQSYGALIHETNQQFKDLLKKGLKLDKIKHGIGAYQNSEAMHRDIAKNNHLYYFPTEAGFGPGAAPKEHPMLQKTEFEHEGKPMLANDVFRIVHDINGHHVGGRSDFSPEGEQQAFLTHKQTFSPLAQKALFTETAGQSNNINFSRAYGKQNRENPAKTVFPQQKAGIMPLSIINGKFHEP